jgi:hypothetical protein
VSKKTRPRRSAPSGKAPANRATANRAAASKAPAYQAPANSASANRAPASKAAASDDASAIVERVLSRLWTSIGAGEPLRAEIETVTCMAIPYVAGQRDAPSIENFISTILVDGAVDRETPEAAALLRLLMALGTPETRKTASRGLGKLTGAGIYPPDWVTEIGKVVPGQAWRRYDVFGDDEAIAVTFSYGDTEHAIAVQVDMTAIPTVSAIGVAPDAATLIEAMRSDDDPFDRAEQISLAEARRRITGPLARCDEHPDPALTPDTIAYLPILRTRVRRLPEDRVIPPVFGDAARAAAVDEFMGSPLAADAIAADEESTRFWAEVLTGYSSRVHEEPPAQVGPRKLANILLGHVVNTFIVSPTQRLALEPAVTAWTRWSAARRGLDEAATARLLDELPKMLVNFDEIYNQPDGPLIRGYVSDLAKSDSNVIDLSAVMGRRLLALPLPELGDGQARPDVTNPAHRLALVAAEFGQCTPPPGMTSEQFVETAQGIVETLWVEAYGPTDLLLTRLVADGVTRHDAIHRLAGAPAPTRGAAIAQGGLADPSMSS